MATRNVHRTGKDINGDITKLCDAEISLKPWGSRDKDGAINDIENGVHEYYSNGETLIHVVKENGVKHLRTVHNDDESDNLDNLPDC